MNWEVLIMQLRISSFNKTLFRKNLTRFWPLWAMASFLGSLFPLVMFMELTRYNHRCIYPLEMTEIYYSVLTYGLPLISLFYAVLCALAVWNYLYNPRSVGLMHTLPITRKGLFLTNFLSGMTMMFIPYVVTGGLMVLISVFFGFFEPVGVLVTILCVAAESFFYFATATAVAFVTGNVFAMPILYFIFHFLSVIMDFMLSTFSNGFLFGLSKSYNGVVEWLSPTVYLMTHVGVNSEYEQILDANGQHLESILSSVTLENAHLIAIYAAAGILCAAAAWLLYRHRRSESAGDVVAVGWMKPVFRWGVTACCALLGGQALYLMFLQEDEYTVAPMVICMLVSGTIGYYAARMLLAKSLRVFKGSWKGIATLAVLSAALCLSLEADLLNIEKRIPAVSSISQVRLYVGNNTYYFYEDEEAELLEGVRAVHAAIAADADYIQDFEYAHNFDQPYDEDYYVSRYNTFEITYTLKSGVEISRRYRLPLTRQRVAMEGTYDRMVVDLVNGEEMKAKRLHFGDPNFGLESGWLWTNSNGGYDFSTREAQQIHEAVYADLLAGSWGDYDFFENSDGGYYDMNLEFNFRRTEPTNGYSRYDYISVRVHPGMVNTVKCLLEMGVVTAAALKTNAELYPDRYVGQNYQIWGEKYGELTSFPDYGLSSSMGIIGGADGPTAIVVADMN